MRIGIHTSTSGALQNAARLAHELGANCFQIFSASPRMWRASMPPAEEIAEMRRLREAHDLTPLVIHNAYLINCASADAVIREKSIAGMRGEFERAIAIGAEYLVMHPGSAKDQSADEAIATLAKSLAQAAKGLKPKTLTLLLENTAGAGATLGRTFEELHQIRTALDGKLPCPVGYCLDTCHLYASGYDVVDKLAAVVREADRTLGLENVPVIHTNDSKGALGSRLDRHMNIGEGLIGREGFRRILNHPRLRTKAFVLETPIDNEGDDRRNVEALKSVCRKGRATSGRA